MDMRSILHTNRLCIKPAQPLPISSSDAKIKNIPKVDKVDFGSKQAFSFAPLFHSEAYEKWIMWILALIKHSVLLHFSTAKLTKSGFTVVWSWSPSRTKVRHIQSLYLDSLLGG